jgi:NAD(P)-dependent dehydrogenase (short-subunit alcohol dehydrogenase family)
MRGADPVSAMYAQPSPYAEPGLAGKVALVTGGTRGLGRRMVSALAASGADVVVTSRNEAACRDAADQVRKESGRRALARPCHLGRWHEISGLVDDVYAEMGRIDILVNNAGISPLYTSLDAVSEDLFDKTIAVNLKGPFRLSVLVGTRMAAGDGGSIISVSSTAAIKPRPAYVPYAAAKAGLVAMSEGLARAFGPSVRSNVVMAGPFLTDITTGWDWDVFNTRVKEFALGRIGQPEEIVGAVLYLASDSASYTTGTVIRVDGGEP